MIDRLVEWALKQRLLVLLGALGIMGGGYLALQGLAVDAFPDVSPVLVQVTTESPGLAPPEVEALVTYPVEVAEAYYQAAAYVAGGEKTPKDALIWLDDRVKGMRKP